jgi:hypothetical protein
VGAKIETRVANQQAKTAFNAIEALTEAARIALDAGRLAEAAQAAAEKGDAKGMITAAVEALKLREVLSGGVSDRTEKVNDSLAEQLATLDGLVRDSRRSVPARRDGDAAAVGRPSGHSTH